MGMVRIDPEILDVLSGYISDIEQRTQLGISETRTAAGRISAQIADEVAKRRRRVDELRRQYEACCRTEDADCRELERLLAKAERALEVGVRAQTRAADAIAQFGVQSNVVVQQLGQFSLAGRQTLSKLMRNLDDYSAFASFVPASVLGASYGGPAPPSGASSGAAKLQRTSQIYHRVMSGNRELRVFDHPRQSAHGAVYNQGSANPGTFLGTCGLCAAGTILRKAGVRADEAALTTYASARGLCTTNRTDPGRNGGTSLDQLAKILEGYGGITTSSQPGTSLQRLAAEVEQGRGVIIGVNASLLNEAWYGPYTPNANPGHWVVLQSVVRDAATNDVLGFYVFDSNGTSVTETCQLTSISKLQSAYSVWGSRSLVTDGILW